MNLSQNVKGILSIIGAFLLHFIYGTKYVWSNINSYFATNLYYNGDQTTFPNHTTVLMPCIILCKYALTPPGLLLGDRYGVKITTLFSSILIILSYLTIFLSKSYFLLIFGMALSGMADGIGSLSLIRNAWKYFPNRKGIIQGIIISAIGLDTTVVTLTADYFFINPEHEQPNSSGIYSKKISDNFENFLKYLFIIFVIMSILAYFLTFIYSKVDNNIEKTEEVSNNTRVSLRSQTTTTSSVTTGEFSEAFFSIKNLELGIFCFCGPFFCYILLNSHRNIGTLYELDLNLLYIIGALFGISSFLSSFLVGVFMDKFYFRPIMVVITLLELLVSATLFASLTNSFLYVVDNILNSLCLTGTLTVLGPFFDQTFGADQGLKVFSVTGILIGLASICGAVLVINFVEESDDYLLLFIIGMVLILIQLVELCFLDVAKFLYSSDLKHNRLFYEMNNKKDKAKNENGMTKEMKTLTLNSSNTISSIDVKPENKENDSNNELK